MQSVALVRQALRGDQGQIRQFGDNVPEIGVDPRKIIGSALPIVSQFPAEKRNFGKRQILAKVPDNLFQILGIMRIFLFGIGLPLMPEHRGEPAPFQRGFCPPYCLVIRMLLIVPRRTSAPFPCGNGSPPDRGRN